MWLKMQNNENKEETKQSQGPAIKPATPSMNHGLVLFMLKQNEDSKFKI